MARKERVKFKATVKEFALFASEGWSIYTEDGITMEVLRIGDPEQFAADRNLPRPPKLKTDEQAFKKAEKHLRLNMDEDGRCIILGRKK